MKRYRHVDDDGRRYRLDDLTAPRPDSNSGKFEWRVTMPGPGRGWGYRLEQLEEWRAEGRIHTKRDGLRCVLLVPQVPHKPMPYVVIAAVITTPVITVITISMVRITSATCIAWQTPIHSGDSPFSSACGS